LPDSFLASVWEIDIVLKSLAAGIFQLPTPWETISAMNPFRYLIALAILAIPTLSQTPADPVAPPAFSMYATTTHLLKHILN
jgi:hypothetical protein